MTIPQKNTRNRERTSLFFRSLHSRIFPDVFYATRNSFFYFLWILWNWACVLDATCATEICRQNVFAVSFLQTTRAHNAKILLDSWWQNTPIQYLWTQFTFATSHHLPKQKTRQARRLSTTKVFMSDFLPATRKVHQLCRSKNRGTTGVKSCCTPWCPLDVRELKHFPCSPAKQTHWMSLSAAFVWDRNFHPAGLETKESAPFDKDAWTHRTPMTTHSSSERSPKHNFHFCLNLFPFWTKKNIFTCLSKDAQSLRKKIQNSPEGPARKVNSCRRRGKLVASVKTRQLFNLYQRCFGRSVWIRCHRSQWSAFAHAQMFLCVHIPTMRQFLIFSCADVCLQIVYRSNNRTQFSTQPVSRQKPRDDTMRLRRISSVFFRWILNPINPPDPSLCPMVHLR